MGRDRKINRNKVNKELGSNLGEILWDFLRVKKEIEDLYSMSSTRTKDFTLSASLATFLDSNYPLFLSDLFYNPALFI